MRKVHAACEMMLSNCLKDLLICLPPADDFSPEDNPEEPGEFPSVPSSGASLRFDCLKTFFGRLTYVVI